MTEGFPVSHEDELNEIRQRYARRAEVSEDQYSRLSTEVLLRVQERQRALLILLRVAGIRSLGHLDILEVGCGGGNNLLEFVEFGADPSRLWGNDLLEDRLERARTVVPASVHLSGGDAAQLPFGDASFDIVYQSTVFSSILDDASQRRLAHEMWRWIRVGGAVLWYDFVVDNPRNPDVRGVPLHRIKSLFPAADIRSRRVTLAPPLARAAVRLHPSIYAVLNVLPLVRTHRLVWIRKP